MDSWRIRRLETLPIPHFRERKRAALVSINVQVVPVRKEVKEESEDEEEEEDYGRREIKKEPEETAESSYSSTSVVSSASHESARV